MLKLISLYTLQQIFETEALHKVSPMAQLCYMRSLIYWFEDMPETTEAAEGFQIIRAQIKNAKSNYKYFEELEKAGLIQIGPEHITFFAKWHRHIDRSRLEKQEQNIEASQSLFKPAIDFEPYLRTSNNVIEFLDMRYKLKGQRAQQVITDFIAESKAKKLTYRDEGRAAAHFINWLQKLNANKPVTSATGSGKILGE